MFHLWAENNRVFRIEATGWNQSMRFCSSSKMSASRICQDVFGRKEERRFLSGINAGVSTVRMR